MTEKNDSKSLPLATVPILGQAPGIMNQSALEIWLRRIETVHFRSIDMSLDRVRRVAHALRLGKSCPTIVVAGTNGKGSSVACLESIYAQAGYRTAAYTSPHLVRYNERVRIGGAPVSDEDLVDAFTRIDAARGNIPLTYFEFGTLAALFLFRQQVPDVCILEVGMGGRLDAVNILDHDIALITEIGIDHQQWLGDTVEQIATEKAGIMRYGGKVVSSGLRPPRSLRHLAQTRQCRLWQFGEEFGVESGARYWNWNPLRVEANLLEDIAVPSGGLHQIQNAAGAVAVVKRLQSRLPVSDEQIRKGLAGATLPGRLQHFGQTPELLLDVSHNADGIGALAGYLGNNPVAGKTLGVFSMLKDKNLDSAVAIIGNRIDRWYIAPLEIDRTANARELEQAIRARGFCDVAVYSGINSAVDGAFEDAAPSDRILAFGSFYAVGDIMRHLQLEPYPS